MKNTHEGVLLFVKLQASAFQLFDAQRDLVPFVI